MVGVLGVSGCSTAGVGVGVVTTDRAGDELRKAAANGELKTVLSLIDQGVAVNLTDECGRSALHWACARKHEEVVTALLLSGAKCNLTDNCGYTGLQRAACEGHDQIVIRLINNNANIDHQDDQHGNTALHEAAWKGYSHTAEALVKAKANVYIKNKGGFAPLHLACQNGHNQTCRVLLLVGCKPDIKNNYGDTALHTAARYGHAGVTRILLSARANVGEVNKNGDTSLHIAAAMGRRKLTKIFLEAAADQHIRNKQNETPEDIAKRKEFVQILDILHNPPPIVTPEERLRQEQQQKKMEAKLEESNKKKDGKDKKREKTQDSGTSSKESTNKQKDKKKHKPDKRKMVGWSPYGCHYFPPVKEFPTPNIDSLPKDPLRNGEQYFIDLAGNIKKGPIGVGYTCYCAPFFKNVENKLEKDKVDLMDHIDAAHDKLDARITSLEYKTKSHIRHLGDNVTQKLAAEKEECRARLMRNEITKDRETTQKMEGLQNWIEGKLSSKDNFDFPVIRGRTFTGRNPGYSKRPTNPFSGLFPLMRSRSEEAISDYLGDEGVVYKGLRVLDHPTSMYNIPKCVDDEDSAVIYDLPKKPIVFAGRPSSSSPQVRSKSAAGRVMDDSIVKAYQSSECPSDSFYESSNNERRHFEISTASDSESGRNTVRGPFSTNRSHLTAAHHISFNEDNIHHEQPITTNRTHFGIKKSSLRPVPYIGNSDDLLTPRSLSAQGDASHTDFMSDIPKKNVCDETLLNSTCNDNNNHCDDDECIDSNKYDYRNSNPYMYDLRGKTENGLKAPYNSSSLHIESINDDLESSSYLDMESRQKIQQAVRRLYNGYIADGKVDMGRGCGRQLLESSTEHDSHNDSGYSTRLCTASQGPSPALSCFHDASETDYKHPSQTKLHSMRIAQQESWARPLRFTESRYHNTDYENTPSYSPSNTNPCSDRNPTYTAVPVDPRVRAESNYRAQPYISPGYAPNGYPGAVNAHNYSELPWRLDGTTPQSHYSRPSHSSENSHSSHGNVGESSLV